MTVTCPACNRSFRASARVTPDNPVRGDMSALNAISGGILPAGDLWMDVTTLGEIADYTQGAIEDPMFDA